MNILRISTFPTRQKSGMGLHPYQLCGIAETYTYFLTPRDTQERAITPSNTEVLEYDFFMEARPKKSNGFVQSFFLVRRLLSIFSFSLYGIKLLISKKVDVVHIHSPMYSIVAFAAWLHGKKVYITFHGSDFHKIKNSLLYRSFQFIYDKVFAISPDMLTHLELIHGKDRVIQINNGIDSQIYINHHDKRCRHIIAVGSLKEEKGFDVLIDAFDMFSKFDNDYTLLIVGEGLLRYELQNKINALGLGDKVKLIGHKSQDELVSLYNESEIFVLSSISEGFPKVLLEAISCGCKVVSTNVGSVSQVLDDYEYIVPPGDSKELSSALINISKKDFSSLKDVYTWILCEYSWKKVKEKYSEVIRDVN